MFGVTQNDPGCPIPAAVALLSAVATAHSTGKVSALTIIQTRNQRTEHNFGCHQTVVPWALHRAEEWDIQTPGVVRTSVLPCLRISFLWPWMSSSLMTPHQAWTVNLTPLPNEDPKPPAKMVMSLDLTMLWITSGAQSPMPSSCSAWRIASVSTVDHQWRTKSKRYFSWKWNSWGRSMHPTYRGGN